MTHRQRLASDALHSPQAAAQSKRPRLSQHPLTNTRRQIARRPNIDARSKYRLEFFLQSAKVKQRRTAPGVNEEIQIAVLDILPAGH